MTKKQKDCDDYIATFWGTTIFVLVILVLLPQLPQPNKVVGSIIEATKNTISDVVTIITRKKL